VSDGKVQGTFPVGDFPSGIAFDGASIWVTSVHDNAVTRLRAKNGAYTKTLTVENYPIGVLCDVFEVSRSGYYAWSLRPAPARATRDEQLRAQVVAVHRQSRSTYVRL